MKSEYKVCPKCGVNHSTLTRHRCHKPPAQKDPPKFDDTDPENQGSGGQGGGGEDDSQGGESGQPDQGDGQGSGDGQPEQGDGEADGEGEGEGKGEGQADGDAQGEGKTDGEGQGPPPKPPEPEAPPVAVVCSVLKFAALTADCADGFVKVELAEGGLQVVAYKGDCVATDLIPWGEFEKRSTLDGEFYVKDVIDACAREAMEKDDAANPKPEGDGWIEYQPKPTDRSKDLPRGLSKEDVVAILTHGDFARDGGNITSHTKARREANAEKAGSWCWGDFGGGGGQITHYKVVTKA